MNRYLCRILYLTNPIHFMYKISESHIQTTKAVFQTSFEIYR